ncbi:short-chain dehydrogenase, partial [bacterium SCGC AG-212-C10]
MPVTVITGTSTGIGQTTALHLARKGHTVWATMRNPAAGGAPLTEAATTEGLDLRLLALDVDNDDSVERGMAEVFAASGQVDVLVNNAGIGGAKSLEETSDAELRAMMETNFFGAMRMVRAVLPGMRERQSGTIVNVTSVAGIVANAPQGPYAASKFALEAASEVLAQEVLRFGIRVAIIEPGVIATPIFAKGADAFDPSSPYADLVRRIGRFFTKSLVNPTQPEAVAEAIEHAITTDSPKLRYP